MSAAPSHSGHKADPERPPVGAKTGREQVQQNLLMMLQRRLYCVGGSHFLGSVHNSRQPDREGRAAAKFARDGNVGTHHLAGAFTDRVPFVPWWIVGLRPGLSRCMPCNTKR